MSENTLVHLTEAVRLLSEARTLDEITHLRDLAQAAEQYARAEQLGDEAERYAHQVRVRAARKAGELLKEMAEKGERFERGVHTRDKIVGRDFVPPTLSDLGITRDESSRWQQIASVPEPDFEEAVMEGHGEKAIARLADRGGEPLANAACAWCGSPFHRLRSVNRFCSRECSSQSSHSNGGTHSNQAAAVVFRVTSQLEAICAALEMVDGTLAVEPEAVAGLLDAARTVAAQARRLSRLVTEEVAS